MYAYIIYILELELWTCELSCGGYDSNPGPLQEQTL